MGNRTSWNPFAFAPIPVTVIVSAVYLALVIPLIIIHTTVPKAPSHPAPYAGINITEAWLDLAELSHGYHPYNSRQNDIVHNWLLGRIDAILVENNVHFTTGPQALPEPLQEDERAHTSSQLDAPRETPTVQEDLKARVISPAVTVFNDYQSNVSFSAAGAIGSAGQGRLPGLSVYFEGTNIIAYIRGTEDVEGEWWASDSYATKKHEKGGVLVNAHYDSVSTGYGTTDDGIGVVTVLQLIRYFTTPGNRPKKGIVALLNNGEEDFLNGARAYTRHPLSNFAYTFLNLEGTGPGGRAVLFRTTDTEVTRAYSRSPHPFGTVVAADGFKAGFIRSATDYSVFQDVLGLRGLDVSFYEPRARYHTNEDDTKYTSRDSLWHMLSTSISTVKSLTSDTSSTFEGPRRDGAKDKVRNGKPTDGVWFDLFGRGFAVFALHAMFAWSLTILIVTPLALVLVSFLLLRKDKLYFFSTNIRSGEDRAMHVELHGWKGVFRFPAAFLVSSGLTVGSAFLVRKFNPLIIYSSQYAVWSMMLSLFFSSFWFIMRGADFTRPSALHRGYSLLWMFILGWVVLVGTTVFEDRFGIASGYSFVFYESAIFLAVLISFLELFALPSKASYGKMASCENESRERFDTLPDIDALIAPTADEVAGDEVTETTPLVRSTHDDVSAIHTTTFANYAHRSLGDDGATKNDVDEKYKPYGEEQDWSGKLPSWTWVVQFLLIGPFMIIIIGQIGLLIVEAVSQTGPDGSALLLPYILIAFFSNLILLPVGPFIHRFSYRLPTFFFHIFLGTLLYSLLAFPFSSNNRYKVYFQQTVDLETGINHVQLSGLEEYVRSVITSLPSAAGQSIECGESPLRVGVVSCSFEGLAPRVVNNVPNGVPPEKGYADWLLYTATRTPDKSAAQFNVTGKNTRACVLRFDRPITAFNVHGSGTDDRYDRIPETGSKEIRLWHREWDQPWIVDVVWNTDEGAGMEGKIVCLWSDNNDVGVIPALDELRKYAPVWVGITKISDGLVEGSKPFVV